MVNEEQKEHINYLELYAGFLTLKALYSHVSNVHIRLCMDNSVSVSYLNNMGGRKKKFNTLTNMIWLGYIDHNIILSSAHIAGSENLTADRLSKDRNIDKEWKLNTDIFHQISYNFGVPCIDLFASRMNKQVARFVSFYPDSQAVAIDAFTISWSFNLCYILLLSI